MPVSLHWFRRDLRLDDNPALYHAGLHAARTGGTVVPVFIWAPDEEGAWPPGAARRWWLHHSLDALGRDLDGLGSRLILRTGPSHEALQALIRETGAGAVFWNDALEPALRRRDTGLAHDLQKQGVEVHTYAGVILHNPAEILMTSGGPYKVFTPFWQQLQEALHVPPPLPRPDPAPLRRPPEAPESLSLDDLALLPEIDRAGGLRATWTPGEAAAHRRLAHFRDDILPHYEQGRDIVGRDGTSRLSPYLHQGEISPRQVWTAVTDWSQDGVMKEAAQVYLRELAWREFSYHLLYHFPNTPTEPLKTSFAAFPWQVDEAQRAAWQQGRTGYPIVDAGMRQLWHTGWMHNRVRMIVASFLTKDLLQPWLEGARWFWDTLVDADLANNTMGWQWSAGSGADAQPFFRIFNPVSQSEKFDPDGTYIRRWVPELAALPTPFLHQPWKAPDEVRNEANVTRDTYPDPIVEHSEARKRALEAYNAL